MKPQYALTRDPIYLITVMLFALLTTAIPAILGQQRFMPIIQTLCLTLFLGLAVRKQRIGNALGIIALWSIVQLVTVTVVSWLAVEQVELAIADGFQLRGEYANWFFGTGPLPVSVVTEPLRHIVEIVGVLLGSLISGGLIGNWYYVRAINLAGYLSGGLLPVIDSPLSLLAVLPLWSIVRLVGYAGFIILLAEPLLVGNWSFQFIVQERRRLLLVSSISVIVGVLLEFFLPGLWRTLFR